MLLVVSFFVLPITPPKDQKCTSKGIRRQGLVSKHRNSLQKKPSPVVICPYLCSSEEREVRPRVHLRHDRHDPRGPVRGALLLPARDAPETRLAERHRGAAVGAAPRPGARGRVPGFESLTLKAREWKFRGLTVAAPVVV